MERLTNKREADAQREEYERRLANGYPRNIPEERFLRLAAYEDIGLTPEEIKAPFTEDTMINLAAQAMGVEPSRLRELAEADKDGRVVVLPCKVGQRVFALLDTDKHISECEVKQIGMGNEIGFIGLEPIGARGREYGVALNGFGKTVFLTREAAEKALEGIKDGY
jgi:hypothetical protein